MRPNNQVIIKGKIVDEHTRCIHYNSPLDIIAIKFKCCNDYYPCIYCHHEEAGHPEIKWSKKEFESKAVLCGECLNEMTIRQYLDSGYECPFCNSKFNPGCRNHYHFYFEI